MIFSRTRKAGRHETAPATQPAERAEVGLFVTPDSPRVGPAAPVPRRAWRKKDTAVPTAPYVEVHAPRTPPPRPAPSPAPQPAPRPYAPEPAPRRRARYVSPPRKAMPTGRLTGVLPGWLYPGYDGTAEEYARVMQVCDRMTGTTSIYSDPKAWPQHALTAPRVTGEAT